MATVRKVNAVVGGTLLSAGIVVAVGIMSPAQAAAENVESFAPTSGCVSISRIFTQGSSKYADVYNHCSRSVSASVDVPYKSDPGCKTIGARKTVTFRASGVAWFDPRDAYEC